MQTQMQNHRKINAHGIFTNYRHGDPPSKSTKIDKKSQGDRVQREEKEEEEEEGKKKKKKRRRETAGLNKKEGKKKKERNKICFLKRRREINMHELP